MPEAPDHMLARAEQLEAKLRDQQTELIAQQKALDDELHSQIEAERMRAEAARARRELLEMEHEHAKLEERWTRVLRWTWQLLGLIPLSLILLGGVLDFGDAALGSLGLALLTLQTSAFFWERSARRRRIEHQADRSEP